MRSGQNIVIAVDWECSRLPVWRGSMAGAAIIWNVIRNMVRVGRLVIGRDVAG